MKNKIKYKTPKLYSWLLASLLLLLPPLSWAAEPAGFVLIARGDVVAVQSDQALRQLKQKSPFFPGESLKTGEGAKVQVRFRDGSLLSLRAETEIHIDEFHFNESEDSGNPESSGGGEERNFFSLIRGGFRAISGEIGKKNLNAYRAKTAVATLAIQESHYEVVWDGELAVAVWAGGVNIENREGALHLGREAPYNFAIVEAADSAPRGVMMPPSSLQQPLNKENVTEEALTQSSGKKLADKKPLGPYRSAIFVSETAVGVTPKIEALLKIDQRLEGVTLDSLAFLAVGGGLFGGDGLIAASGLDAEGDPVFAVKAGEISTSDIAKGASYLKGSFDQVIQRGGAPDLVVEGDDAFLEIPGSDEALNVSWGAWNGGSEPFIIQHDPLFPSTVESASELLYWMTLVPSTPAEIGQRTGTVIYDNPVMAMGGGTGGTITLRDFSFSADINFSDGAITNGALNVTSGSDLWGATFAGNLDESVLDVSVTSATLNSVADSATANINSVLTGPTARGIGGGFYFEEIVAPADPPVTPASATGIFLIDCGSCE